MGKVMLTAAGVATGMAIAGTMGVLVKSGKIRVKKPAKKIAKAFDSAGDAMHSAARMAGKMY